MSGRGRGGGGGGRGRGRGGGQPSQSHSQDAGGRGNAAPRVPPQTVASTVTQFGNLSVGSSTPSPSTAPAAARATAAGTVPQQPVMQQNPVQTPPAPVVSAQQPITKAAQPPQASSAAPTSSRIIKAPPRTGYGTLGRKCVIRANHFLVDLGEKDPYQYDVSFLSIDYF